MNPLEFEITRVDCILNILQPKKENFQIKKSDNFHISTQNVDCGYSLEYPQSLFLGRKKKNNVHSCKPSFTYKCGLRGSKLYRYVFVMMSGKQYKSKPTRMSFSMTSLWVSTVCSGMSVPILRVYTVYKFAFSYIQI